MTSSLTSNTPVKKRRRARSLERKRARAGWLFVLPFLIGFILIYLPIVFESVKLTFCESTFRSVTFIGWDNYKVALLDYAASSGETFLIVLFQGMQQLALDVPAILIFSLFMAVLLNQKMAGRAAFRAIFFVPVILSTGLAESVEAQSILGSSTSINTGEAESTTDQIVSVMDMEALFSNLMVGQELAMYVTQLINNIFGIVNRSGVQMLIFLAGLQSISPAIYESCQIDGATSWETFWKITFPMISPMILVNAVYTVIDAFTLKDNVVMSWIGGLNDVTDGVQSAMYWMYFLSVVLIIAAVAGLISAFVFYQRRD